MAKEIKLTINYMPPNWNEYITIERTNKYKANKIKQQEKQIMWYFYRYDKEKYEGKYPVELTLKPHYSSMRQDLDNFRYKGILDGLVYAGVLKNDNLKCIRKITIEPVFDEAECVEIVIKEL